VYEIFSKHSLFSAEREHSYPTTIFQKEKEKERFISMDDRVKVRCLLLTKAFVFVA